MDLSWIFFALVAAVSQAALPLMNEYFQVRSIYLMFWMRALVLIAISPLIFVFTPPEDPLFYLFVFMSGCIFAYFDLVYIGLGASKGAGAVTRIEPLSVGATFLMWLMFAPALLGEYMSSPLRSGAILLAFAGSIYFGLRLRHCEISRDTLRQMALPIVLGALGIILGKLAMDHSEVGSGVAYYCLVQTFTAFSIYVIILNTPILARLDPNVHLKASLFDKKLLIAGGCIALNWLIHTPSKYYAIDQVENPAYVTVITLTSPLWVLLVYKLIGRREKADITSGLGIVFCALILVLATQL